MPRLFMCGAECFSIVLHFQNLVAHNQMQLMPLHLVCLGITAFGVGAENLDVGVGQQHQNQILHVCAMHIDLPSPGVCSIKIITRHQNCLYRRVGHGIAAAAAAQGLDIGPDSIKSFSDELKQTKTVVWNGPMGVFEFEKFAKGTIVSSIQLSFLRNSCVRSTAVDSASHQIQM